MLLTELIHPQILSALASAGHGSKILIADGNYPLITASNPAAQRVYLNLRPGQIPVDDILEAILSVVPVEAAFVMIESVFGVSKLPDTPAFNKFELLLAPSKVGIGMTSREQFYEAARGSDVCLAIASGDERPYANIMLRIGVRPPKNC